MAELNEEKIISVLQDKENCESSLDVSLENSPLKSDNLRNNLSLEDRSSDDDGGVVKSVKRRIRRFSDSDSEVDKENKSVTPEKEIKSNSSESEDDIFPRKSRLVTNDSTDDDNTSPKNESARISDRRSKLHNKFKLLKSRSKAPEPRESPIKSSEENDGNSSDGSNSGIESIKQKIKQNSMLLKSGICDPDTSSDEESSPIREQKKSKPRLKSTILTSPKPISKPARMSAKQAMENMQKIKSESNRMLREKEVTLPYHRPKALSLKDIMNRRKPALSADGKALPVKMNSDQLKQYVKLLEQRNKEMMELCKSESEEEEETNETNTDDNKEQDVQCSIQNDKEVTSTNDNKEVESPASTHNENEETPRNDTIEPEPHTRTYDCQELTDNIVKQQDENAMPDLNTVEETNEDDLPDLMVEIVQKEQNISNTDVTEKHEDDDMKDVSDLNLREVETNTKLAAEVESQLIELRYETEKMQNTEKLENDQNLASTKKENEHTTSEDNNQKEVPEMDNNTVADKSRHDNSKNNSHEFNDDFGDDFSDVDINMEDLENIIENAKNDETAVDSPMLIRDPYNLNKKPKLTGAPGMVIDLDGSNPVVPRKLTGVELLKERFTYFAKLKTPEEKERERELKIKPGMQHLKLKQELEEKISEQRSLEWAKRLEDEKQQQDEMDAIRGDESDGDDLEKIEAKLQEHENVVKESSSESEEEEEEEEQTCNVKDKPRKRNPMIDDEAEVSDDEEAGEPDEEQANVGEGNENAAEDAYDEDDDEDSEESSDESSDDETENQSKPRKSRILKAFEDSDDESTTVNDNPTGVAKSDVNVFTNTLSDSQAIRETQDDVLPLAQVNKSISEDLFGSQTSSIVPSPHTNNTNGETIRNSDEDCADMTTQTFSILNSNNTQEVNKTDSILNVPVNIDVICESQPVGDGNLDDALAMCSGKFTQTQNVIPAQSQIPESQCVFSDDILEMCTGKFYDNEFVSQAGGSENEVVTKETSTDVAEKPPNKKREEDKDLLDSILQEMDVPVDKELNKKKYVFDNPTENEAVSFEVVNQVRKKFTIDSDDESNVDDSKPAKKKKLKKRKLEKRALQISDDEEDEELLQSDEEAVEYMSEVEDDGGVERIVEYDSEENEVEVKPQKQKGRKMAEFFEQEAELTSEDEWVGSGDEDERGLDRMEREEGDDDTFHQGQLQRELGQIHMREVLDQDKREVRLIQELLFEDGDLGDGGRQRKFRWKNLDGDEETGSMPELFAESQEDEFESEEQWRKQRHEREVFLRNLKENDQEDQNISIDRSSIIKANLCSKTMSSLLLEVNGTKIEETTVVEKKAKEEPCRKLPLTVFQQNYHGSLLTRGRGALARLAALAMPLAGEADDDSKVGTVGPSSKRNFVFATVTPPAKDVKAPKRKAEEVNVGTPRLLKKFKTDDNKKMSKTSLLDHLKAL